MLPSTHAAKHDIKSVKNDHVGHVDHNNELGCWLLTSLLVYIIHVLFLTDFNKILTRSGTAMALMI